MAKTFKVLLKNKANSQGDKHGWIKTKKDGNNKGITHLFFSNHKLF